MIFGHGNGEVTDYWLTSLDGFRERGIGVLLVEYPGYGRSTGSPSEAAIRIAMDAAYDRIAVDPRVDRTRIFGFGQSLGGVIHGRQDHLIPWQQAQRLASASARSTFKLYDCGHGCWDPEHLPLWQELTPFLSKAGILQ